jgi:hypothetical protein
MAPTIKVVTSPDYLDENWDELASCYFQKKEFLAHLHQFNPCNQRYYQLYANEKFVAGAVVYSLQINLFTFSGLRSNIRMRVIGLPVSVAASSLIGKAEDWTNLINLVLKMEKGVILGMNLPTDFEIRGVVVLRTLPTVILKNSYSDFESYIQSLRHPYRHRLRNILAKAEGIEYAVTKCNEFSESHYRLYLEIMKRTKTKLETLSFDLFKNLPGNFILGSEYFNNSLLAWHTLCYDGDVLYFFFGGMDYEKRDRFQSYNNNLISILKTGLESRCKILDFGQTAEIAKMRLGGRLDERGMFIYHKNPVVKFLFWLGRSLLTYSKKPVQANVFK